MIHRLLVFLLLPACLCLAAEPESQGSAEWEIRPLNDKGWIEFDLDSSTYQATNGVLVKYGGAVLTAEEILLDQHRGEVTAHGTVRIQQGEQIWASEHIRYNFFTREIAAEQFRSGKPPVFAGGEGLHADLTNKVYTATNAFITTEDISNPFFKIRARHIRIVPEKRITARDAVVYAGQVPVFYFPYFTRRLTGNPNNISLTPGYRSVWGPFLLSSYRWYLNEHLDGQINVDWRAERGLGAGPDINFDYGKWGRGEFRYYYLDDQDPNRSVNDPVIPSDRQRVYLAYDAHPATNINLKSMVRYQTDPAVVRDFFEGEYRRNSQPNTFFEATKFWENFSLDLYAQPRVNEFLETVERLPEVRLTGYRQQLGETPFYYESQSSAGYYRRLFAVDAGTNGPPPGLNYSAGRADTYHQVLMPQTFFGWLNVTPRVGGRLTYYTEAHGVGGVTDEEYRGVFNTGMEVSFKASRLWPEVDSRILDLDGVRHIIEPSANYVYVPEPTTRANELPQFDYEFASLRLLPIEFTDYNAIDAIDTQHAVRLGVRNRLQTKRNEKLETFLNWHVYTDWRVRPRLEQTTFSDLFSDVSFKPQSWLGLESLTRYDIHSGEFRLALHTATFQPNETWSLGVGNWYLRDDPRMPPEGLGEGNNLITTTFFYKLNENWAFRTSHHFEAKDGRMEEQYYTLYRDFRSWTGALILRFRDNRTSEDDVTVAFTFSLKAAPRFGVGRDTVRPYSLLGG